MKLRGAETVEIWAEIISLWLVSMRVSTADVNVISHLACDAWDFDTHVAWVYMLSNAFEHSCIEYVHACTPLLLERNRNHCFYLGFPLIIRIYI